jgi:hypothetical protein
MKQEFVTTPTAKDLAEMNKKISTLKERARMSKIEARDSFNTQLRAVEDQYDLIVAKMNRVTHRADAATGEVREGISKAWVNLKSSFDNASKYLH